MREVRYIDATNILYNLCLQYKLNHLTERCIRQDEAFVRFDYFDNSRTSIKSG